MARLRPQKLHVRFMKGAMREGPLAARRYTLTHSDLTGDIFLTISPDYDLEQVSGWYTRLMRDEIRAEWKDEGAGASPSLHIYCHVGGGLIFGTPSWRESIFRREMPLVLEALRYGDEALFSANPELDGSPIIVHYRRSRGRELLEGWGTPADHRI